MSSRFKGMFEAAKEVDLKAEKKVPEKKKTPTEKKTVALSPTQIKLSKREKGSGKSSNPDYVQALAYVKKETLKNVQRTLFEIPEMDYSDLIESLLADWLKKQK